MAGVEVDLAKMRSGSSKAWAKDSTGSPCAMRAAQPS